MSVREFFYIKFTSMNFIESIVTYTTSSKTYLEEFVGHYNLSIWRLHSKEQTNSCY